MSGVPTQTAIRIRTALPGPRSVALADERRRYVAAGIAEPAHGIYFERAEGARLVDVDGNVFLDFAGGIGCLNAGHSAPRVIERVREQLTRLQHACFMVAPYEPYVALARRLCEIVPIAGPSGNLIIDIGGGTSEIAVIALGGIVVSHSLRVGGNKFDEAISTYIRKKYNLMVGERTAEEVKIAIGTALPLERELSMEVRGRDLIAGLPRTIPITSSEVMEAIEQPLQSLVSAVRLVLEETPPELSSDIIDKGMILTGGGAILRHLPDLLMEVTGVPCYVADDPLSCVAVGTGLALEHMDILRDSLEEP